MGGRTKAHQRYYVDGLRVPGATTVVDVLGYNKRALIGWARKTALAGEDPFKVRDEAADIGTIAHGLIEELLTGREFPRGEYPPAYVETAEGCLGGFEEWVEKNNVEAVGSEVQLTHKDLYYGGTIDFEAVVDGMYSLIDFKTSSSIWMEHRIQLASYAELLRIHKGVYPKLYLLHLDKEAGCVHTYQYPNRLDTEWLMFLRGLEAYWLQRFLEGKEVPEPYRLKFQYEIDLYRVKCGGVG